jgi:methyl-accepting chemotaxis protein
MLTSLRLSTKLFGFSALLLLVVLGIAFTSVGSIRKLLSANMQYSGAAEHKTFMVEKSVDHLYWIQKLQDLFVMNRASLDVQLDHTQCGLGLFLHGEEGQRLAQSDPRLSTLLNDIKEPHKHLHESARVIKDGWKQRHKGLRHLLKDRLDDHRKWAADVSRILAERNPEISVQTDPGLCAFGKFMASDRYAQYAKDFPTFREAMDAVKEPHRHLHESAGEIQKLAKAGEYDKAADVYRSVTLGKLSEVENTFRKVIDAEGALEAAQEQTSQVFEAQTLQALTSTQAKMKALQEELARMEGSSKEEMVSTGAGAQWLASLISLIAFVFGGVASVILIRSITKPIKRTIDGLGEGAEQVTSAAGQVTSASQSLAEGASEQAASIEETSSSLEEMASMTKQNAEHADQADALMKETGGVVAEANASMQELNRSMQEITQASEETSKIIKTIDEIAFQTNLLALNAAVEAARAGEAGAGFAVVAGEVRNLAMRAADAAKNTSILIEGTVKKVKDGSGLVVRNNEAFRKVADASTKVANLVAEIAAASKEQSQGIEQVNKAVVEMDKVVQQNAANAEENASASEEMNAQTEQMKGYVNELMSMVGASGRASSKEYGVSRKGSKGRGTADPGAGKTVLAPALGDKAMVSRKRGEVKPEHVIPLKDEDFADF